MLVTWSEVTFRRIACKHFAVWSRTIDTFTIDDIASGELTERTRTSSLICRPVAAPGHQSSQVISRSENHQARSPDALFSYKMLTTVFIRRPQNTGRQRRWLFHCQNKTNKAGRYGNIFISCSYYYWSKARHGGVRAVDFWARSLARAVDLPASSFDLARPGVAPPLMQTTSSYEEARGGRETRKLYTEGQTPV